MMCEKCGDRGFIEYEHGLVNVLCDCEAGRKMREKLGIPDEVIGDNTTDDRTGQPAGDSGSETTGKPKQHKKSKARKSARTRAG